MITCCVARVSYLHYYTCVQCDLKGEINESYKQMNVYTKEYNCSNCMQICDYLYSCWNEQLINHIARNDIVIAKEIQGVIRYFKCA